jgi:alkylation response protein AidB-like acyl-CoA dehydrogenase
MTAEFETSVRDWVAQNLPAPLAGARIDMYGVVSGDPAVKEAFDLWRRRLAAQGVGRADLAGGIRRGGVDGRAGEGCQPRDCQAGSMNPIPYLSGMGVTMVGPTLLEYGTPEQKTRHLPAWPVARCAGALVCPNPMPVPILRALTTSAELDDEGWVLNGQKTWTSGADKSQWCGVLVRTDRSAAKRDGISFLMLEMKQPGIVTRPISLIAGESPLLRNIFHQCPRAQG